MSDYNGYANYQTWNVCLWMDNDRGMYEEARRQAKHISNHKYPTRDLADWLKDWICEGNPLASDASMWSDLLSSALDMVNWYGIAGNLLEGVEESEAEEDDDDE